MEKSKFKIINKMQFFEIMRKGEWKSFVDSVIIKEDCRVVNTKKINGYTLLSCATQYGDKEIVEYLMQNGANCDASNSDGSLPLHVAAKHNHKDLLELFAILSVSVDCQDNKGRTALHYATDQFHNDTENPSSELTSYCDKKYNATTIKPETCPIEDEHMELASLLLRHGADVDVSDKDGVVPLRLAATHSCPGVVEMLIRRGADVEFKCYDEDKWTILHHASFVGWLRVVQCLVERRVDLDAETSRGYTSLLLAAENSRVEIVELLVKSGANVDSRGFLNTTALHYASQEGWLNVVKLLVEYEADIDVSSCSGATPVMLAVKHMHRDIFDFLVENGAFLVGTCEDKTILHFACDARWVDVVQSLVDDGCDIHAQTSAGETPLLIAAWHSSEEIVDILIESGADVYALTSTGKTPLHVAVRKENPKIVKRLLDAGAYADAKTFKGKTPLYIAVMKENLEIVMLLMDAGADVNYDTYGTTPLYLAVDLEYMEIATHLLKAGADCNEDSGQGTAFECYAEKESDLEDFPIFIESGAYITNDIYYILINNSHFKEEILKNAGLCTQAILNKFNNLDLHQIYEVPFVVKNLPPIKKINIRGDGYVAQCIENSVKRDIETNGFCNITKIRPIVLSLFSVEALIKHYIKDQEN